MAILFLDTESDAVTKQILSIQCGYDNDYQVYTPDDVNYHRIADLWHKCDAVVMYNAPYDLGVLSSYGSNKFTYKNGAWNMKIFGCSYRVKRINGFRNLIHGRNCPPVIDLLKLWSIFIEDTDISLKSLIRRELGEQAIPYSPTNARQRDYQLQDVIQLAKLWRVFLERVATIPPLKNYSLSDYAAVSTPATCAKRAYKLQYPDIAAWQKYNMAQDHKYNLSYALEQAYNGGVTMALYRGTLHNTAWYDIHGAYAHVIEFLNTDRYKRYHWTVSDTYDKDAPALLYVSTNVCLTSINHSLKLFRLKRPVNIWMWSYDKSALENIFADAKISVLKIYIPIPEIDVRRSLSAVWSDLKEEEERAHGKTTLREYYKFMSNTSYGITAQRNPYPTVHTNLCIAGMITARTHLILSDMIRTAREHGYTWVYSDTDSICITGDGDISYAKLEREINATIAPYSVGCEFIGDTRILSLKRYHAYNGVDISGARIPDKIRLHGKSVYRITDTDMLDMLTTGDSDKKLIVSQVSGNTAITYDRVKRLNTKITNPHPYMFETNIDSGLMLIDWFDSWLQHIDRKATTPKHAKINDEFAREFIKFDTITRARLYYGVDDDGYTIDDITGFAYRLYDIEDKLLFDDAKTTKN